MNKYARPAGGAAAVRPLVAAADAAFRELFAGSPVKRIGRNRMIRNCLIAAGNSGDDALIPSVEPHLLDPDPVIAESARWALDQIGLLRRAKMQAA